MSTTSRVLNKKEIEGVLVKVLDYFSEDRLLGFTPKNTASLRRVLFFRHFLSNSGNATRAAIQAGYSPKSAKQQGYRVLKWLQEEIRKEAAQTT